MEDIFVIIVEGKVVINDVVWIMASIVVGINVEKFLHIVVVIILGIVINIVVDIFDNIIVGIVDIIVVGIVVSLVVNCCRYNFAIVLVIAKFFYI